LITQLLGKLARPSSKFRVVKKFVSLVVHLMLFYFLFYSLVYVQCDRNSTRQCPLPFDPHAYIDLGVQKYSEFASAAEPKIIDIATRVNEVTCSTWKLMEPNLMAAQNKVYEAGTFFADKTAQLWHKGVLKGSEVLGNENMAIMQSYTDYMQKLVKENNPINEEMVASVRRLYKKVKKELINESKDIGKQYQRFKLFWHAQSVKFIDELVPKAVYTLGQLLEQMAVLMNQSAIKIRYYVIQLTDYVLLGVSKVLEHDSFRFIANHPLLSSLAVFKDAYGPALSVIVSESLSILDHCWAVLEGRGELVSTFCDWIRARGVDAHFCH
jgi:hypothetical protein